VVKYGIPALPLNCRWHTDTLKWVVEKYICNFRAKNFLFVNILQLHGGFAFVKSVD